MSYRHGMCLTFILFNVFLLHADVHFDFDPNVGLDPAFFTLEGGDDDASKASGDDDGNGEGKVKPVFEKETIAAPTVLPVSANALTTNEQPVHPSKKKKPSPLPKPSLNAMSEQELVEHIRQCQQKAGDLDIDCVETNDAERKRACKKKLEKLEKRIAAYQKALEKKQAEVVF